MPQRVSPHAAHANTWQQTASGTRPPKVVVIVLPGYAEDTSHLLRPCVCVCPYEHSTSHLSVIHQVQHQYHTLAYIVLFCECGD